VWTLPLFLELELAELDYKQQRQVKYLRYLQALHFLRANDNRKANINQQNKKRERQALPASRHEVGKAVFAASAKEQGHSQT